METVDLKELRKPELTQIKSIYIPKIYIRKVKEAAFKQERSIKQQIVFYVAQGLEKDGFTLFENESVKIEETPETV